MASRKKRHHQVPRAYLERFASSGKVRVLRRDGRSFDTDPVNVAVESGFYDVADEEGGKSSEVEDFLEAVEGSAHGALGQIDRSGRPPTSGSDDRRMLARFLALQMSRTTQQREQVLFPKRVVDWANGRQVTRDLVAEYLRTEHLGFTPTDREVDGAFVYVSQHLQDTSVVTSEFAVEMMLAVVAAKMELIQALYWTIETDPRRQFITSDVPVIPWRKPTYRDNFEGLGIDKAEELRFPLDPGKQLVMSRRNRRLSIDVAVHRVKRANADLAAACHRFIVGSPENPQLSEQRLDPWRPVLRFNVGPLFVKGPDGQLEKQPGDVIQIWVPRGAGVGRPRQYD